MGVKIIRYPNMKILPNDGVKFKCKCGCEFVAFGKNITVSGNFLGGDTEFYYAKCPECQKSCISDDYDTIHNYWDNENPNCDRPKLSYMTQKSLNLRRKQLEEDMPHKDSDGYYNGNDFSL